MLIFKVCCMTFAVLASGLASGSARDTEGENPAACTCLAVIFGLAAIILGVNL